MAITCYTRMADLDEPTRESLRALSLGRDRGQMWRWTYNDGSTFAAVHFDEHRRPVAWACLTLQEEPHAVIGVFVAPSAAKKGIASQLIQGLLRRCRANLRTPYVYAVAERFRKYPDLIAAEDLIHLEWT